MRATNREAKKTANRQKLIEATIDSIAELGLGGSLTSARAAGIFVSIDAYKQRLRLRTAISEARRLAISRFGPDGGERYYRHSVNSGAIVGTDIRGPTMGGFCLRTGLASAAAALWLLGGPAGAQGEPGVFDDRIVFGQSAAFKGPAAALGIGMRDGILAAFQEANEAGGIKGRRLELISYNDGYEPEAAIANTNRLIDEDQVFALIGEVGTPTSKAVQPIASDRMVPFLGPFTGAAFLRRPSLRSVVNVRASYDQETETWIEHLTGDLGFSRIAILYQDDSFGRAGLKGVRQALEKRRMELVAEGTYKRNTTAVKRALLRIRKARPEAVVMVGAYKPCAAFIKLAQRIEMRAVFVNISFVGSKALSQELGAAGEGVIVTQVVPLPEDTSVALVARYQRALKAMNPDAEPGFVSLEGYMAGRLVVEALRHLGDPVTRAGLLATITEVGAFDLDGITLTYGPNDNQGMDRVFITVIQADGSFKAVDRLDRDEEARTR